MSTKKKSPKITTTFLLTHYLQKKAEAKLAKAHHRQEKRAAKLGQPHTH
jgi:hypothetical protein